MTTTTEPTTSSRREKVAGVLRGSGGVAIAIVVMNIATYGFQMVAARLLGPAQYGGVASLMALLMVVAVAQLGLQAVGARRVAGDPDQVHHIERVMMRATYRVAAGLALLLLVLAPLVKHLLRLDSITPALLIAVAAVPSTIMGGQSGIVQGERRWLPLGMIYLSMGVTRLVVGSAFLVWRNTEGSAMAGVTLALFAPAAVGWWVLRGSRGDDSSAPDRSHHLRPVLREVGVSSQALLAFFVLSNIDIVVARNVLDSHQAGLYAGGLIVTKAVLFLPQFVVIIAFPSMSTASERQRAVLRSLAAGVSVGAASVLATWLLSDLAVVFVGGDNYTDVRSRLWVFALLGTLLALLQMLTYSVLARQGTRSGYLIWVAVVALVLGTMTASTLTGMVVIVIAVDATLVTVLLALSIYRMRVDPVEPAQTAEPLVDLA